MAVKSEVIFYDDGGSEFPGPRPNKSSIAYEFSQACRLPFQKGSVVPSGSREYEQFTILKQIDKTTPLLWKTLCEGAELKKVEVILYEIGEKTGSETPYFKYTLDSARIAGIRNWQPSSFEGEVEEVGHLEEISLVAQTYNWEHLTAKTLHSDQGYFVEAGMR